MKQSHSFFSSYFFLLLITLLIKIPFLFTHHIQEDAFITWNVAQNLIDYGVIGFNGEEPISASTTHLYVFLSAFFQLISGEYFVYVILLVNSFLFGLGSIFLGKVFFSERKQLFWFVILLNLLPPSITASVLGMEYGLLFFLYTIFIYYAVVKNKNIVYFILPILLIWTRLDTVIFLGILGLLLLIFTRKINPYFFFGGLLGLGSVLLFNYLYFGDIVNHTIVAKKIAYPAPAEFSIKAFFHQLAYYGGYLKISGTLMMAVFYLYFVFAVGLLIYVVQREFDTNKRRVLLMIFTFAVTKITIFVFLRAHFDWYYWLPRVFMAAVVVYFIVRYLLSYKISRLLLPILFLGFGAFQYLQSLSIGYMEYTQRIQMVKDLEKMGANKNESIVLEPAGKIPFYTRLKTWDEVGLVDKKMTNEMIANFDYVWINLINKYHPTYILTIGVKAGENGLYRMSTTQKEKFDKEYTLLKEYPIKEVHQSAPFLINTVYNIRPIGQNYFLYKKK
ncbi:hypothetical protein [Riemerella anatipestifer]|uniref:hypothetical protein n=1 Tax=Riemerella anatipestifer TaxID=34085 RepID=UPI00129E5818|nr:hypothetical protein [Riemerella anatipestifer]MBT0552098.1 hypothetical protein [Riemerella anatipestifer]MBT0554421.1 hypothetical protein [Riemerella anatipestifer]MCE3025236.1 hypothetical protein [Riemerella anatipestifer]MCU7543306.1 hypothetical protein [Riemerella anatipestifer]MCU7560124.1 hypothetical protein [Riemerella anatipestifer]